MNANFDSRAWAGLQSSMPAGSNVFTGSGMSGDRLMSVQGAFFHNTATGGALLRPTFPPRSAASLRSRVRAMVPTGSWSAAAVRARTALVALAVVLGGAAPIPCAKPQTVLRQAAELATSGKPEAALHLLETFLTKFFRRLNDACDSAIFHVKAASYAGSVGDPERAQDHLREVVRLLPGLRTTPPVACSIERPPKFLSISVTLVRQNRCWRRAARSSLA